MLKDEIANNEKVVDIEREPLKIAAISAIVGVLAVPFSLAYALTLWTVALIGVYVSLTYDPDSDC